MSITLIQPILFLIITRISFVSLSLIIPEPGLKKKEKPLHHTNGRFGLPLQEKLFPLVWGKMRLFIS
ncbi:hypothetical protein [Paenibacillus roseipurpureus]|uniref:Uncharacterized protein n=1 Tax=Paenibacillus roseopurpureus TaxID=2918901 RepID=A0AA96LNV2_9BACL|nr:hypothetical protein [Paenibacillus sp. MBLB1832]WNR43961.1 hypothetical protein MJB10_23145 [Paenibacillus sp. MBLB1832]